MQRYRGAKTRARRPFWLPASNYYILAAAATIAFFFLVWGILHDGGGEMPFITAGIGAALVLGSAVIVREIVLRAARNRFLESQAMLDRSLRRAAVRAAVENPRKLTLERNAAILAEIARKSEAARVLGRFAEAHREVFDLCEEYLTLTARELPTISAGSPRLAALRRGTAAAERHHHFHLMQWAEIQARDLTREAAKARSATKKLAAAHQAMGVVDFALKYYPHEAGLVDSEKVLRELVTSIKVTDFLEKAERASFKGNTKRAVSLYKDALFEIERKGTSGPETAALAERIRSELDKLSLPEAEKKTR